MTTALLEVDFQRWIVSMGHDPQVVPEAVRAREEWRRRGAHVFCLRYLDLTGPRSDPANADPAFVPELLPERDDLVLSKHTRDAFDNPDLHTNLAIRSIDRIVITGLLTEHGVSLAARSALNLGYAVTVIAAACAAATREEHERALAQLGAAGVRVC